MRIAFMSDLHREFWPAPKRRAAADHAPAPAPFGPHGPDLSLLRGRCDALVIAGDFDVGTRGAPALVAASHYLDVPVLLVPGNHEFFGGKIYKVLRELRAALAGTRVHLLDRDEIVLSKDGLSLRFLGTTLWTDFALNASGTGIDGARERDIELAMDIAGSRRNDFKRITVGPEDIGRAVYRRLIPRDTLGFHVRDRRWLRDRLAEPFDGRTVVVTHMAPSARSVPGAIRGDWIAAGDASNLEDLIEEMKPDFWIHGHTHISSDYAIASTRVVSNPFGYWGHELNPDFAVDRVVDLAAAPAPKMEI